MVMIQRNVRSRTQRHCRDRYRTHFTLVAWEPPAEAIVCKIIGLLNQPHVAGSARAHVLAGVQEDTGRCCFVLVL